MRRSHPNSPDFMRQLPAIIIPVLLALFSVGVIGDSPLPADEPAPWMLGLSTFARKSPSEQAQQGPQFQFPMPAESTSADASPSAALLPPATIPASAPVPSSATQQSRPGQAPFPAGSHSNANTVPAQSVSYPLGLPPGQLPPPPPLPTPPAVPSLDAPAVGVPASEIPQTPISQAIAAGETAEAPPLAEETTRWYHIPWQWVTRGWDNHAELGLDGSSGNSRTLALQTGLEMKRKTDRYTLAMDFDYRKATTTGVTTEDNGRLNLDYDRLFEDSKWSAFGKFGAEWDQFKSFDARINLNGGIGYHFVRTDSAEWSARFGAGASQEIGAPDDSWKAEAVFGTEAEYQLNRYNKMKGKVEYFPAWEDFSDYRLVSDVAWEILLDDTDNLSLKLALTDRYDSTPQGAKANDVYYSMLLLVKF